MIVPISEWVWMPHAGHFICAFDCRFHLNTRIGKFIVSTVGELWPDAPVREMYAQSRGIVLTGRGDERQRDYMRQIGYEDIGWDRKYETMVFIARPSLATEEQCCPWRQVSGDNIDFRGYQDAWPAMEGHMEICREYAEKQEPKEEST